MASETDSLTTKEIIEAEEERCRVIAANDWAALDKILGDDFTYTHSVGFTEDKASWMASIADRPRVITRENLVVRPLGDVALLQGRLLMTVTPPDGEKLELDLDVLQVWTKRNGAWQLIANHGVKNTHNA
jgi:ketosteroid isomerase-like protein